MWIFFNNSFLSVVDPSDGVSNKKGKLLVRARYKGDIENVFPDAIVVETPKRDYLYRAMISREKVAEAVANSIKNIDYDNFKNSIPTDNDWFWRHNLYLDVWTCMYQEQSIQNYGKPNNWIDDYYAQKNGKKWFQEDVIDRWATSKSVPTPTVVQFKRRKKNG